MSDRHHLEGLWRNRLIEAKKNYAAAAAEMQLAGKDFQTQLPPTAAREEQLLQALRAERATRDEYMRVLQVFTDLVVSGIPPKEES